jgi:GNAT superfamily N-acetyltransferase
MQLLPTKSAGAVKIRPMRMTDVQMETEFIRNLSPLSKHYRFLGGVKELSPAEVSRLCNVDGKHSMAFVATVGDEGHERAIGVSRYAPNSHCDVREIAVTVADEWQHRGIGTLLMKQLIESAQINGVKKLYSIDLNDNIAMRTLATDLGMRSCQDPSDPRQTIYSLTL